MAVSVIIPSRGWSPAVEESVRSVLSSLALVDKDTPELLLVLNGPQAGRHMARVDDPRVTVLVDEVAGAARARNSALDRARYDCVLFTDDDCVVPINWCRDMLGPLGHHGAAAGPIRVAHQGPITAFLDYKRVFAAPPIDERRARYFITANCALRRSGLPMPARFDQILFNNAAEDSCLGYALVNAGIDIAWTPDMPPVVHRLPEAPSAISERFLRYGRGNARLVSAHGCWQESVPCALEWLESIRDGTCWDYRRFAELDHVAMRDLFVYLDLVLTTSWLLGFISDTQERLGLDVLSVDLDGLNDRLEGETYRLVARLSAGWSTASTPSLLLSSSPHDADAALNMAAALRDHVLIRTTGAERSQLVDSLARHADRVDAEQLRSVLAVRRLRERWLRDADVPGLPRLEALFRREGVAFADGLHELEKAGWTEGHPADQRH